MCQILIWKTKQPQNRKRWFSLNSISVLKCFWSDEIVGSTAQDVTVHADSKYGRYTKGHNYKLLIRHTWVLSNGNRVLVEYFSEHPTVLGQQDDRFITLQRLEIMIISSPTCYFYAVIWDLQEKWFQIRFCSFNMKVIFR